MKPTTITPLILQKLGFPHPIDYDVKPDGTLAVIDYNGQKFVIPYKDYSALLSESDVTVTATKKRRASPASSPLT